MIIEGGAVAPYVVAAEFYQTGPEHDAEDEPAEQDDDGHGRRAFWEGARVDQGAEEDREEACFQELDLPTVTIPILTNIYKRHIEQPKNG
jgi:hypothetical protein